MKASCVAYAYPNEQKEVTHDSLITIKQQFLYR